MSGGFGGHAAGLYGGSWVGRRSIPASLRTTVFDSGLSKPFRAIVQDAIIDALARLHINNGGYLYVIESIESPITGPSDVQGISLALDQLQGRAPAVLVASGDQDYDVSGDVDRWRGTLTVPIYVITNSLGGRLARVVGDATSAANPETADPGAFVIMEHLKMLLVGQIPGGTLSKVKELRPRTERMIAADNLLTIWEQVYYVWTSEVINTKRDLALELKQINAYHRTTQQLATDTPILEADTVIQK